jgi:DNA-binding transcriptional ArsR family regulator
MKTKQAVEALASLAQDTRLQIFRLLVRAGHHGLPAGDIAEGLGVPKATLSFHLAHLTRAGLLDSERKGRSIIYTVRFDGVRTLLTYLMEDCCQGRMEAECCSTEKACDHE